MPTRSQHCLHVCFIPPNYPISFHSTTHFPSLLPSILAYPEKLLYLYIRESPDITLQIAFSRFPSSFPIIINRIRMAEAEGTAVPPPQAEIPAVASDSTAMTASTKPDDSKALATTLPPPKPDSSTKKSSKGSLDRDVALAQLETEKRNSYIKAWEESEKSKVENKAQKKLSAVGTWENTKKANIEAKLKTLEEQLEQKKAEYAEKIKNRIAALHKEADEKRAMVEARRGEELLKAEEMAAKYRATGQAPKKIGCLGC